jgi:hypothetical protein
MAQQFLIKFLIIKNHNVEPSALAMASDSQFSVRGSQCSAGRRFTEFFCELGIANCELFSWHCAFSG